MSTIRIMTVRCGVCRSESKHRVLTSTNAFGAPDLDLIPPEPETQELQKLEIKSLSAEKLDDFMITLINCFSKHQEMIPHYLFLHEAERNTLPGAFVPESAITNVPLSMRWCHAKRVSLMSLGGGSIWQTNKTTRDDASSP